MLTAERWKSSSPMKTRIRLPKLHPGQAEVKASARRFNVINCGRRWGKTVLGIDLEIDPLIHGYPVAWFSPTYKMLSDVWRQMKMTLAPVSAKISEQEHRIELMTGGILDMWSLDSPDAARGRKYKRVVIDEAAMIRYLEEAWTHVIRPTLADLRGDAFFASTPKGLNYFYTLYCMDGDDWLHMQYPTISNPYIQPSEVEEMRRLLPDRVYQQEILAEFVSDGTYFQGIEQAAVIDAPDTPDQHKGHSIFIGADWAISQDWTVITAGCRNCNRVVDWERFNKIDFTYQRARLVDMAERWHAKVLPERNSIGTPNIELLVDKINILSGPDGGKGFNTTATTKPELIQALASALEHHNFKVPTSYADELRAYQIEMTTAGHPKFGAPEGLHDDRAISLALCWWGMTHEGWYFA